MVGSTATDAVASAPSPAIEASAMSTGERCVANAASPASVPAASPPQRDVARASRATDVRAMIPSTALRSAEICRRTRSTTESDDAAASRRKAEKTIELFAETACVTWQKTLKQKVTMAGAIRVTGGGSSSPLGREAIRAASTMSPENTRARRSRVITIPPPASARMTESVQSRLAIPARAAGPSCGAHDVATASVLGGRGGVEGDEGDEGGLTEAAGGPGGDSPSDGSASIAVVNAVSWADDGRGVLTRGLGPLRTLRGAVRSPEG